MSNNREEFQGDEHKDSGTGSHKFATESYITRICPFKQYLIIVKLTTDGRFVGIEEVRVNKDFRSYKQKISQKIHRYVDEYEPE